MRAVLITAGATRNPIDAIRYLSASSSGRTGVWLAEQLAGAAAVTLLGSPEACLRAEHLSGRIRSQIFGSTRDLMGKMARWITEHPGGVVVHASAVGDYEVATSAGKIPSGQASLTLTLQPAPKILAQIRGWSPRVFLVSFKAAPPQTSDADLEQIARNQRLRSGSDLVFANVIGKLSGRVLLQGAQSNWHADRSAGLIALRDTLRAACVEVGQP